MSLSERNQKQLHAMRLIESVSGSLGTVSWILGGFTPDIHLGRILRDHDDLDYITLNLHPLKATFVEKFSSHGFRIKHLENGDLSLKKEGIKVHMGNVECGDVARWTHNGENGFLLFSLTWLSLNAVEFYGMEIHVIAPELQYVLKEYPQVLNPNWITREKDSFDKEHLKDILLKKEIDICSLHKLVISR